MPIFWLTYRFPIGRAVRYPNGRVVGVVVLDAPDLLQARFKGAVYGKDRGAEPAAPIDWSVPLDALPEPEASDYEFAVAIFERLRTFAPILTDGLIDTLGKCDKRALLTLFGMNATEVAQPEPEPPVPERELLPHERWPRQVPDNGQSSWTWNDRGERQQRLPSSFPRRDPYSGGSHWSR